jgi:predicted phage-related endonuclease
MSNHDELVAKAKATLITKPKATKANPKAVEASDPILINELLAERSELSDAIKQAEARKTEIENVIKDIIGDKEELLVHGAKVAFITRTKPSIAVDTAEVKEQFPFSEYPTLYKKNKGSARLYIS